MKAKLEWLSEEEGRILFFDKGTSFLTTEFFVMGEGEAEFRIQDIVFPLNQMKNDNMPKEVTCKAIKCVSETFRLLWEEGLEDVALVEQNGTNIAEILDSTAVVQKAYSEYMMKRCFLPQKSTGCGKSLLQLTKTEDGYICENIEKTFFCRLLTYDTEKTEESGFYLYGVEVDEKKRNRGIATACLKELFLLLSKNGPVAVHLQVGSYNEPAVHLYKKLGFEVSEELCYYASEE